MRYSHISLLIVLSAFSSCQSDQKKVDQIANDMCRALSNYSEEDSNTLLEAATNLEQMNLKYKSNEVCPSQLKSTMEKTCPESYKKLVKIVEE